MSKEETIGTLENAKRFTYGDEKFNDAFDSAINYIKETVWIPVTERLPEKSGLYFVTKENDLGKYVDTEWFYQAYKTWATGWKVIAWMPLLPEPYKKGE